ncbi:putative transcription factor homeo protein [Botrytis fragariae]|uniref:Putative transcription factor homeo protein n=1 Tax=Botrytis fragariae TaxID=1964551 RepID=A0A8H6AVT2_9HELO|nr:putative transcription factor homeo protein [Botrytis fragariae]KAF5874646.1 putative transcription factor homeo protein [Botrytis fragariae]
MEAGSEQSLTETAARWIWSLPEEDCLTRLIKKHKKRVEDGEVPKGSLFEEVSIELNGLGFDIQRTGVACEQKWRRICNKKSMLQAANAWQDDQDLDADFDAEHSTADENKADGESNNTANGHRKRGNKTWTEDESRILYEEIKTRHELNIRLKLPKFSATQLFNHASDLLKVQGYFRTPPACSEYWRVTGRELWNYDERNVGDSTILDARDAKCAEPSSSINDRALGETKNSRGVLSKSQTSALSRLATESLNPSKEQQQKLAKDHGISIFQISTYFANKRSTRKKEMAKKASDQENSKRKQSVKLEAELAGSNDSIVAQADDVLRDTKKRRLSSSSQMVSTEFIGSNAPIEINSSPMRPTSTMEDTASSDDEAGFKKMQEMVLVQRRRIEERIVASIDRRKQLELETIRHQTKADMEREAAEGTQKKVDEELKVEARLRMRLNQIGSL